MFIGIVGKSNTGKTTLFSAATMVDAEISNRIFTTIKPNKGVGYATKPCPCKKLNVKCNPNNSKCVNGIRLIPIKLLDVAGLVPGAHKGKGMGNQFLSDLTEADILIHVVDASGSTDTEGNPVDPGSHEPMEDVLFLEKEIDYWILSILQKNWKEIKRKSGMGHEKFESLIHKQLSGLGITEDDIKHALGEVNIKEDDSEKNMLMFIEILRKKSKPIIIAANKIDIPQAETNVKKMQETADTIIPCSAECELALRKAEKEGDIRYTPGSSSFELIKSDLEERKRKGLELIKKTVLEKFGSTGVQQTLNKAVDYLDLIAVYPVANMNKYSDKNGNVLPDVFLIKKGATLRDFAAKVHTDLAEHFIGGLDTKKRKLGADYELKDGDVVEILFKG